MRVVYVCSSHRVYISQAYILDRRVALIEHTSHRCASQTGAQGLRFWKNFWKKGFWENLPIPNRINRFGSRQVLFGAELTHPWPVRSQNCDRWFGLGADRTVKYEKGHASALNGTIDLGPVQTKLLIIEPRL